jgi:hypothetical protein
MFGAKPVTVAKVVAKAAAKPLVKPLATSSAKPLSNSSAKPIPNSSAKPTLKAAIAEEPLEAVKPGKFQIKKKPRTDADGFFENVDLQEMATLIRSEEKENPYEQKVAPAAFVPETRRGFSSFIKQTYENFTLEPTESATPTEAGEKYPYQKFVREYMRQDSPYRGVITYHGLGSGKTCTAIATAEALFSTANKKIIVMTPASLKKNFLKEVSLCGFRHFRLQNFWTELPLYGEDGKPDATARLFGSSVLGLSESHLRSVRSVWIPDFRKTK